MKEIVLVHGAFQGGWTWDDVAEELRGLGWRVHAPTLSGCGYLRHGLRPGTGLNDWVTDVTEYLRLHTHGPAVLAGNSFAGLIVAAALMRAPERVSRAVFIDAVLPRSGQSFLDMAGPQFATMLDAHTGEDGMVRPWPPKVFGIPEEIWPAFGPRLATFPRHAFETALPEEFGPQAGPCSFIACTETVSPFIRAMARRAAEYGWPVLEMQSGHCPMTTHPRKLAELLRTPFPGKAA